MPLDPDEIRGLEFDWFAVDRRGFIALCATSGSGEVPDSVLAASSAERAPSDWIDDLIDHLPELGDAQVEGRGPGACGEWLKLACRGLYIYDWRPWSGPYERIVVPSHPIQAAALPADLRQKVLSVTLPGVLFAAEGSLLIESIHVRQP